MKVAIVLTRAFVPNAAGVQRTTFKIGKFFHEHGLSVFYYSLADKGHSKVEFGTLKHSPIPGGTGSKVNLLHVKETMRDIHPDIVINQMPYEDSLRDTLHECKIELSFALLACLRNSLFTVKDNIMLSASRTTPSFLLPLVDNKLGRSMMQWYHKRKHADQLRSILDKNDRFILLAPPNQQELEYFIGDYQTQKVTYIPNSIPQVFPFEPLKKEKIILYVGSINIHQKRADLLVEFWQKAEPKLKEWQFVVVGGGEFFEPMQEAIAKKRLPRISLTGHQNPDIYYKKASIFVMTSAFEGFPNVLLEAQSNSLVPVVFNSYAVLSWIVNNREDAILVKPFDTDEMATKVVELGNDSARLEAMARNATSNAEKFTIDIVGPQWLSLFDSLMQ